MQGNGRNVYPFPSFPTYLEIKIYIGALCRKYADMCTLDIIGITKQMAEIYMIRLQKNPCDPRSQSRNIVFIDGTIHAREWLACSTAVYLINYLVINHQILDCTNFYIVPCLNVDGYLFSHRNPCYRLWRKNRTLNCSSDVALQGVDLNRNFPIGYAMPGSSDDPSAYDYRGEQPLSEPACQALAYALNKYRKCIKMYISLHCYGNCILYPWTFTRDPIPDCHDLENCALAGQKAFLKASCGKRNMRVGNSAKIMNLAAGTSTDFARYVHGIKFCYIFELQGYGCSGFTPDKKHIPQIGYETTMAVLAMATFVNRYFKDKPHPRCTHSRILGQDDCSEDDEDDDDDDDDDYEDSESCEKPRKRKRKAKCIEVGKICVEANTALANMV